ncbi:uncharacterized protein LOC144476556 [Augochlora pura]
MLGDNWGESTVTIKCETPVDQYSFVDEDMSMGGLRTASSPAGNPENMTCPSGAQSALAGPTSTPPGQLPVPQHLQMNLGVMNGNVNPQMAAHQPKKRGRKKKSEMILTPEEAELAEAKKRAKTYKERKKHDRFDGMPEEEVSKRVLPDHLTNNLDIIIVSPCNAPPLRSFLRATLHADGKIMLNAEPTEQ